MEKVRLSMDELQVQSFATTREQASPRGTVRGHDAPTDQVECPTANPVWDSCWDTCADTYCCGGGSGNTCDGSCDCYSGGCNPTIWITNCW